MSDRVHKLEYELRALATFMEQEQELRNEEVKEKRVLRVLGRLRHSSVIKALEAWCYVAFTP
jgi:hypothetical protein